MQPGSLQSVSELNSAKDVMPGGTRWFVTVGLPFDGIARVHSQRLYCFGTAIDAEKSLNNLARSHDLSGAEEP